jgi:hypothetical protein
MFLPVLPNGTHKLNSVAESASELYRPSDLRLSEKLMPIFADRGCYVVSVTDPHGRVLGFQGRSRDFFSQAAKWN